MPVDGVAGRRARWPLVRWTLFALYGAAYVVWSRVNGLVVDRISVLLSVAVLLVIAHVGQPVRRWGRLGADLVLYVAMWLAYEETRGIADRLRMPLQVESVRNIDRFLSLGADPTVWL